MANGGEEAKVLSCKVITRRELLPDVVGSTNTLFGATRAESSMLEPCRVATKLMKNINLNKKMKNKEFWKSVILLVISVLTAALTAISTTSCMGHGPLFL